MKFKNERYCDVCLIIFKSSTSIVLIDTLEFINNNNLTTFIKILTSFVH